nr:MAG TPA: repressor protein [Bacteriophage sp.]
MELYERIKELAANKKISIRQLEETLKFGNGTINRWRTNTPGIDKIQKVADHFDVSVDYLLGRTDDPKLNTGNVENEDDYEQELIMMFRKGEKEVAPEKRDLYRKQTKDLMSFISKTMKELDEENE